MFGYAGKVLYVDLTHKKTKTSPIRSLIFHITYNRSKGLCLTILRKELFYG